MEHIRFSIFEQAHPSFFLTHVFLWEGEPAQKIPQRKRRGEMKVRRVE